MTVSATIPKNWLDLSPAPGYPQFVLNHHLVHKFLEYQTTFQPVLITGAFCRVPESKGTGQCTEKMKMCCGGDPYKMGSPPFCTLALQPLQ